MYWPKHKFIKGKKQKKIPYKFNIGDKVRVSYHHSTFERAYNAKWSSEIFKIQRRYNRQNQPMYKLADWFNNPQKGTFYQAELQKVESDEDSLFLIDKVIKYKGRGKSKEDLVSWKGWPDKFNLSIPASNLIKLKHQK